MKHIDLQKQYKGTVVFEIRGVQPTWATNPAGLVFSGNIYIE